MAARPSIGKRKAKRPETRCIIIIRIAGCIFLLGGPNSVPCRLPVVGVDLVSSTGGPREKLMM